MIWYCWIRWRVTIFFVLFFLNIEIVHWKITLLSLHSSFVTLFILLISCINSLFDHGFWVKHQLKGELIWTKTVVIPTTYTIRYSKSSILYKIWVFTLIGHFSNDTCTLKKYESWIFIFIIFILTLYIFIIVIIKWYFSPMISIILSWLWCLLIEHVILLSFHFCIRLIILALIYRCLW